MIQASHELKPNIAPEEFECIHSNIEQMQSKWNVRKIWIWENTNNLLSNDSHIIIIVSFDIR